MIRRGRKTDLSDEQLLAMGEIAYWAARVERTLGLVVAGLVNKDYEAGQLVTNGMAFHNLLVLGTRLVSLRRQGKGPLYQARRPPQNGHGGKTSCAAQQLDQAQAAWASVRHLDEGKRVS